VRTPTVVLVEGESDRVAVRTLAARRGLVLDDYGVAVVAMGGATEIRRHVALHNGSRLAGLCDVGEERFFRSALGVAPGGGLAERGFFVCDRDLEDELIRALGPAAVEDVIAAEGELRSLRRFQDQPAQRERDPRDQLRRFLGTRSGRKAQYARALVEALGDAVPEPLEALLAHVTAPPPVESALRSR